MYDLLFTDQRRLERSHLLAYARQLHLDLEPFEAALDSGRYREIVAEDIEEGKRRGVSGTPTFFVNGQMLVGAQPLEAFTALIEAELARLAQSPAAMDQSRAPPANAATAGPPDAPVQLTVFADFQSPLSAQMAGLLNRLLAAYPTQIHLQFRHYPLPFHHDASLAHEAALAAGEQGQFWAMHDLLFAHANRLQPAQLVAYAQQLQLDVARFQAALEERVFRAQVQQDIAAGKRQEVRGVPTLFVNGARLDGVPSLATLQTLVETAMQQN